MALIEISVNKEGQYTISDSGNGVGIPDLELQLPNGTRINYDWLTDNVTLMYRHNVTAEEMSEMVAIHALVEPSIIAELMPDGNIRSVTIAASIYEGENG